MVERHLFPETRFRIPALCCLVGAGCSVIYIAGHPGSQSVLYAHMRDLQSYLGVAFCILALFYLEHYLVRRFTTCKLDDRWGRWQSLGSSALILAGALAILRPAQVSESSDRMLIAAAILGELLFIWNVIRTFTRDEVIGLIPSAASRLRAEHSADNFGWPKSVVTQFAAAAGLFGAGGLVSIILNVPSAQIPVPFGGQMHLVHFGWLCVAAAIPFAFYAWLYKGLSETYRIQFDDSLNRWHFAVTIVGVILVIMQWEQSVMYRATALSGLEPLAGMAGLSAIVFAVNVYRGFHQARSLRGGRRAAYPVRPSGKRHTSVTSNATAIPNETSIKR